LNLILTNGQEPETLNGRTISKLEQTSLSWKSRCSQYQMIMSKKDVLKSHVRSVGCLESIPF